MAPTPGVLFACYPISWIITLAAQMVMLIVIYRKQTQKLALGG
jgi:hypothetical protein